MIDNLTAEIGAADIGAFTRVAEQMRHRLAELSSDERDEAPPPREWHYGQALDIASPQAGGIQWAHLRNGVTTHSFNNAQRLVDLPITAQGGDTVRVTVTDAPNIAPPGWYMLFLTDSKGIPSLAHWVHLTQP